ncbi:hypothetical protein AYK24_06295 [Thermoplasmatales archaeon SG8-52-4]|nr:MAG: hypothetical protein AYK24_06295 [Thermoplasmatales archaeon SG8-52-4]
MGKEKIIPILALIVILISGTSTAYIYITQTEKDTIAINGEEYTIEQLFYIGKIITIQTTEGEKTGISLEDLILKIGISCPTCFEYTIKGNDGYEKTVSWDILNTGILTDLYRVYFPDTPKAFWVRDIIEIEVK